MKLLDTQLQNIKGQLEASPWLKWAILGVILLGALFIVQGLHGVRIQQQKQTIETELNLQRTMSLKGQDVWLEREKTTLQLHKAILAQLPEVATTGMAQAAMQTWMRSLTAAFDSTHNVTLRVNSSAPAAGVSEVLRVNATISGAFSPRQTINLLRQIESSPNLVTVETINLQSNERSTLNITLNAYYKVTEGAAP